MYSENSRIVAHYIAHFDVSWCPLVRVYWETISALTMIYKYSRFPELQP